VRAPEGAAGVELVLEPAAFPPAREDQRALLEAGIPATALVTGDLAAEVARLRAQGVTFRGEAVAAGPVLMVLFEGGCGSLLQLVQPPAGAGAAPAQGAGRET